MPDLTIAPMSPASLAKIERYQAALAALPQVELQTEHVLHAGMYGRTVKIPAGVGIAGVTIKIDTVLIISGHGSMNIGGEEMEIEGYAVIPAAAGRKQAFVAKTDTLMTMIFPTEVKTVYDAEEQFTDEGADLMSRKMEAKCQA